MGDLDRGSASFMSPVWSPATFLGHRQKEATIDGCGISCRPANSTPRAQEHATGPIQEPIEKELPFAPLVPAAVGPTIVHAKRCRAMSGTGFEAIVNAGLRPIVGQSSPVVVDINPVGASSDIDAANS